MIVVDLNLRSLPGAIARSTVVLREFTGQDELWNGSAVGLIDELLDTRVHSSRRAAELTLTEIDLVLTAIYRHLYGDEVESLVGCGQCGVPHTLSFSLTDAWANVMGLGDSDAAPLETLSEPDERGIYRFGRTSFRLPTGEDVLSIAGLAPEEAVRALKARCVLEFDGTLGEEALDRMLSLVGPTLDQDLDSKCPHCDTEEQIPFRLEEFLLASIRRESSLLIREVHELAKTYRWSRREILEMPRWERRRHAGLILAGSAPRERSWA